MTEEIRLPVLSIKDGNVVANSRDVADYFEKAHRRVLQDIRELECSVEFHEHNFVPFKINDLTGISTSHYEMSKDGFVFLAMGFTGAKAARFKEAYITQFNAMEAELRNPRTLEIRPILTPDDAEMRLVSLAHRVKGRKFASALWDSLGFPAPYGFEASTQLTLFAPANQNLPRAA